MSRNGSVVSSASISSTSSSQQTFYDFSPTDKKGLPHPLSQYRNKVVLLVNIASKCGLTPQLTALETIYKSLSSSYKDQFVMLGIPCNQFGSQSPGSDDEIQEFCMVNYGVSFTVLAKTDVNGDAAEPVWKWMQSQKRGVLGIRRTAWNFEKFLVGKDGNVLGRWAPTKDPLGLKGDIVQALEREGHTDVSDKRASVVSDSIYSVEGKTSVEIDQNVKVDEKLI